MTTTTLTALVEKQRLSLCKDCRWFIPSGNPEYTSGARCNEPRAQTINWITGERGQHYCDVMRGAGIIGCGEAAKWFQPSSERGGE